MVVFGNASVILNELWIVNRRAITKAGKETSAQTLQGVGRGLAQAKSGSLTSPAPKNSKNTASISAGPFAFSDDDDAPTTASEKGGKQAKTTASSGAATKGGESAPVAHLYSKCIPRITRACVG